MHIVFDPVTIGLMGWGVWKFLHPSIPVVPLPSETPLSPEPLRVQPHTPHIDIVLQTGGQWVTVETLEGGVLTPANHGKIGVALTTPGMGIRWNDLHIEEGRA